jgi:HD-GYP domain-containing protein (c-di-GMP phosphodiesterase class II)
MWEYISAGGFAMRREINVGLFQFVFSLSEALGLINPAMSNHHKRAAYIALRVAEEVGLTGRSKEDIIVAAALHDIGGLSSKIVDGTITLETQYRSARFGYQLLQKFKPFSFPALIVRFHNVPWAWGTNTEMEGVEVPTGSHIVHLANLVNTLLNNNQPIFQQTAHLYEQLKEQRDSILAPSIVDAFLKVSANNAFWLDLISPDLMNLITARTHFSSVELNMDGLLDFAELMSHVIDFRSRFTATHSSGVATVAGTLGQLFGLTEAACKSLQVAGYLHDIGKLAIPIDVLEKQGTLTEDEWHIVRGHSYFSYRILSPIQGLEDIALWCGQHHERLNGGGYPFCVNHADISLEARILTIADIFTALTEDRPYREGLDQVSVLDIINKLVIEFELDGKVFKVLKASYHDVNRGRVAAQSGALREYKRFMEGLTTLDLSGARSAHLSWKARLRSYMDGKDALSRKQLVSHRECELGRWYHSEGIQLYGRIPEMQALEQPHEDMHRIIRALVDHHEHGRYDEAESCYEQVEPLSMQIVSLLTAIERNAAKSAADSITEIY